MTLYIAARAYITMKNFVKNCNYEISGAGKVVAYKDGLLISEVRLVQQEVSSSGTKMNADAVGKLWNEIIRTEGDLKDWQLWWHSHAKMNTFWSQTDVEEILDRDNETRNNNWLLSLEFNHKMDWIARLDVFSPIWITKHIDKMQIVNLDSDVIKDYCIQEIRDKVTVKTPPPPKKPKTKYDIIDPDPLSKAIADMKLKNTY